MHNIISMVLAHISKEDKIYGGLAAIWGVISSFGFIDAASFWQIVLQGSRSIFFAAILCTVTVVLKAMLKPAEPHISKWSESMIVSIKSKFKKNGKKSNNKAA